MHGLLTAQKTDYLFKHITTEHGLVSKQVSIAIQDKKGFMWIGTQTGLQRYDGKRFITYLADVHNPDALQSDWVNTLFEDSKGRLWIGTTVAGASLLNRATQKFYNFNLHLAPGSKKLNGIWQFIEDKQHNIWISANDGFYKFDETHQQFIPMNTMLGMEKNVLPSSITVDIGGNLWFGTTSGIKMLNIKTQEIFDKNNNPGNLAILNLKAAVASLRFDTRQNAWVSTGFKQMLYRFPAANGKPHVYTFNKLEQNQQPGTADKKEAIGGIFLSGKGVLLISLLSRGMAVYDYATDSFTITNAANNKPQGLHLGLNTYGLISIQEDKENYIWISSDEGINIFQLESPPFVTYGLPGANDMQAELPSEVSDFVQGSDGDIYMSYYIENGGIKRFDKKFNLKQHYLWSGSANMNADENQLWSLFRDNKGIIWAPNQAGNILMLNTVSGKFHLQKDSALHGQINQIKQDEDNNTWIAHDRKGLLKIDAGNKQITTYSKFITTDATERKRVMCLFPDHDKIWLGTILHGLQLFDKRSGTFTESFQMNEKDPQSISNNNVMNIISYNEDSLIIATLGGINIFNKKTKSFTAIGSKDGLPNNLTQGIILDDNKNLWVAFAGGMSKVNMRNLDITNYDENDGIIDNRFNNTFVRLQDGRFAIGASKSWLVFNPNNVPAAKDPPDVTITSFKVFEKLLAVDSLIGTADPIELSYKDNSLHIEFSSLQFTGSNTIKYYYQLKGIDKEWLPADDEQSIHYNQLLPGDYVFKVKSANRDGIFSRNITTLHIRIIPPFWQRWWFLAFITIMVGSLLYAVIMWREKNIKEKEAGKTRLQKLTAENYKARFEAEQINSFFTTSLLNKNDVDDVLWDVAKNLIGKLNFVDCMIYMWNADKTKMIQKAGYGQKGSMEELEKKHFDAVPGQGVVGAVIYSGEAILIADTSTDERYRVDDVKRLSEICVPIKYNEQLIGIIDSEHPDKNFFTPQHLQALTTIATLMSGKIKSIESEQRLRQHKAELADINQQLAEVQLASLRSQMNPHFIFNALNSIKKFVIANEPANAEKYLGKFSKLIRSILDNSRSGMVTVEKELQLLHLYLDLEQLRFGTKLIYTITVNENIIASEIEIPSMIVQPFVENAMLHGIMHREDGGKLDIHFVLHAEWLEISIEDNGVGRAKSAAYKSEHSEPHHSIGIEVATKRLQALKKNESTPAGINIIDLVDATGEGIGTKVIIEIPIY